LDKRFYSRKKIGSRSTCYKRIGVDGSSKPCRELLDRSQIPFYHFVFPISPLARPVVIDGSRELINDGFYGEAMMWIVGMRSICQQAILQDAPADEQKKYTEQYDELLAKLGFHSPEDFPKREEMSKWLLEEVMQIALQIVETNNS
jgi:hypothetical protein